MLTPHCSAVSGMVAPSSTAPITRARKSSEYGFAIHAGLLPAGSLNHIRAGMGIPLRFSLFGKRSNRTKQRSFLRLAQLVFGPDFVSVCIRNKDKAESRLVTIYPRKMLEEVFPLEIMDKKFVVKH